MKKMTPALSFAGGTGCDCYRRRVKELRFDRKTRSTRPDFTALAFLLLFINNRSRDLVGFFSNLNQNPKPTKVPSSLLPMLTTPEHQQTRFMALAGTVCARVCVCKQSSGQYHLYTRSLILIHLLVPSQVPCLCRAGKQNRR